MTFTKLSVDRGRLGVSSEPRGHRFWLQEETSIPALITSFLSPAISIPRLVINIPELANLVTSIPRLVTDIPRLVLG